MHAMFKFCPYNKYDSLKHNIVLFSTCIHTYVMTSIPKLLAQTVSLSKLFSCTSPRYVCIQLSLVPPGHACRQWSFKQQFTYAHSYTGNYTCAPTIFQRLYSNAVNKFYTTIRRIWQKNLLFKLIKCIT